MVALGCTVSGGSRDWILDKSDGAGVPALRGMGIEGTRSGGLSWNAMGDKMKNKMSGVSA